MTILNTLSLESNKQIRINFGGGDLSSDGGLLLVKEFAARIGLIKLIKRMFKTNDHSNCRTHTDPDNLMQIIYQIIASYFEDDCADELTYDSVLTAILDKDKLASQPTLSRFWNRMDLDTLAQFDAITSRMRELIYAVKLPEHMLFDLDSTLLNTYGTQEKPLTTITRHMDIIRFCVMMALPETCSKHNFGMAPGAAATAWISL